MSCVCGEWERLTHSRRRRICIGCVCGAARSNTRRAAGVESGQGYSGLRVRLPVVMGRLYDTVEMLRIMCRDKISLCGVVLVAVR